MARERLQKILAAAGVASRRECEEIILEGVVKVNGKRIDSLPAFADATIDTITVRGKPIKQVQKVYYLLNKPKNVVTSNSDPTGRDKAIDFIKGAHERVFAVGKLDYEIAGALILTNDTELSSKLTHPKHEPPKTYVVQIKALAGEELCAKLTKGIWLSDGKAIAQSAKVLKVGKEESSIEIVLGTELDRQIRRMLAKTGAKVKSITRTKVGKISIGSLKPGQSRRLTTSELAYLKRQSGLELPDIRDEQQ